MNSVLHGESLPLTLSIHDKRVLSSGYRVIDSSDTSIVCDVRSREFCEKTSSTAHRGSTEPTAGRTPDANCDHIWELVRADELKPLPRANEKKCKEIRY